MTFLFAFSFINVKAQIGQRNYISQYSVESFPIEKDVYRVAGADYSSLPPGFNLSYTTRKISCSNLVGICTLIKCQCTHTEKQGVYQSGHPMAGQFICQHFGSCGAPTLLSSSGASCNASPYPAPEPEP